MAFGRWHPTEHITAPRRRPYNQLNRKQNIQWVTRLAALRTGCSGLRFCFVPQNESESHVYASKVVAMPATELRA